MRLQPVHLALIGGAHGTTRTIDRCSWLHCALTTHLEKLAKAGFEDALQTASGMTVIDRALIQRIEVRSAPEVALELLGLDARLADGEDLAEYKKPGHEGHRQQQCHHQLHDDTGIPDQRQHRHIVGDIHEPDFLLF